MRNKKKITIAAATFGIAALAMGGSTFAWFQVVNTANLAFQGTIVGVDSRLEVGFRTDDQVVGAAALGLVIDTEMSNVDPLAIDPLNPVFPDEYLDFVYWAPNSVTAEVMDAIIEADGFNPDNELSPITSGSFEAGVSSILPFYSKPVFNANETDPIVPLVADVSKTDYIGFSIVFRAINENDVAVPNVDITFDTGTDVSSSFEVDHDDNPATDPIDMSDALRIGFDNGTLEEIIGADAIAASSTEVGGVMDLNGDGVNDYTLQQYILGVPQPVWEVAYGEFDAALVTPTLLDPTNWSATGEDPGVAAAPYSNDFFFSGETGVGVRALETATPLTAEFSTIATYQAAPLATTDIDGLAEVDFMIWLEGWDYSCLNTITYAAIGATFTFIASTL